MGPTESTAMMGDTEMSTYVHTVHTVDVILLTM